MKIKIKKPNKTQYIVFQRYCTGTSPEPVHVGRTRTEAVDYIRNALVTSNMCYSITEVNS